MSQDTLEAKKSFGERYSDHAIALSNNPEYVEAGDLGRQLGAEYMKQLDAMIEKHSNLKGIYYFSVVLVVDNV